jgi:hypothetical protein
MSPQLAAERRQPLHLLEKHEHPAHIGLREAKIALAGEG